MPCRGLCASQETFRTLGQACVPSLLENAEMLTFPRTDPSMPRMDQLRGGSSSATASPASATGLSRMRIRRPEFWRSRRSQRWLSSPASSRDTRMMSHLKAPRRRGALRLPSRRSTRDEPLAHPPRASVCIHVSSCRRDRDPDQTVRDRNAVRPQARPEIDLGDDTIRLRVNPGDSPRSRLPGVPLVTHTEPAPAATLAARCGTST